MFIGVHLWFHASSGHPGDSPAESCGQGLLYVIRVNPRTPRLIPLDCPQMTRITWMETPSPSQDKKKLRTHSTPLMNVVNAKAPRRNAQTMHSPIPSLRLRVFAFHISPQSAMSPLFARALLRFLNDLLSNQYHGSTWCRESHRSPLLERYKLDSYSPSAIHHRAPTLATRGWATRPRPAHPPEKEPTEARSSGWRAQPPMPLEAGQSVKGEQRRKQPRSAIARRRATTLRLSTAKAAPILCTQSP